MEDAAERRKRLKMMRDEASVATISEPGESLGAALQELTELQLTAYTASTPTGASLGPLQAVFHWQIH